MQIIHKMNFARPHLSSVVFIIIMNALEEDIHLLAFIHSLAIMGGNTNIEERHKV